MKQIELTVSVRNNLLKSRRKELGLSQKKLAHITEVPMLFVASAERLRPLKTRNGELYKRKLATFFEVEVLDLFPPALDCVVRDKTVREVDVAECKQLLMQNESSRRLLLEGAITDGGDVAREQISNVVSLLPGREAEIIKKRFGLHGKGPMTLEEIGKEYGIGRERVRIVESRAIRRLRHPRFARLLREAL